MLLTFEPCHLTYLMFLFLNWPKSCLWCFLQYCGFRMLMLSVSSELFVMSNGSWNKCVKVSKYVALSPRSYSHHTLICHEALSQLQSQFLDINFIVIAQKAFGSARSGNAELNILSKRIKIVSCQSVTDEGCQLCNNYSYICSYEVVKNDVYVYKNARRVVQCRVF